MEYELKSGGGGELLIHLKEELMFLLMLKVGGGLYICQPHFPTPKQYYYYSL